MPKCAIRERLQNSVYFTIFKTPSLSQKCSLQDFLQLDECPDKMDTLHPLQLRFEYYCSILYFVDLFAISVDSKDKMLTTNR